MLNANGADESQMTCGTESNVVFDSSVVPAVFLQIYGSIGLVSNTMIKVEMLKIIRAKP